MLPVKRLLAVLLVLAVPVVLVGAADQGHEPAKGHQVTKAVCIVHGTKGNEKVHGVVWFSQEGDEVHITGHLSGLTPGEHAFHVHEFGDCSTPDAMSAGGHFNPEMKHHGGPTSDDRHVGDLGNIKADDDGKVQLDITDHHIKLHGAHSILGRSIIVHAMPDDLKTNPAGNAGARIGCGVIGIANPKSAAR